MLATGLLIVLAATFGTAQQSHAGDVWQPTATQLQMTLARAESVAGESVAQGAVKGSTTWPSSVTGAQAVATTRQLALDAMGTPQAVSDDNRHVILYQVDGAFAPAGVFGPSNKARASIKGGHLQIAIDADTGDVTDFGVVDYSMSLSDYGPIIKVFP